MLFFSLVSNLSFVFVIFYFILFYFRFLTKVGSCNAPKIALVNLAGLLAITLVKPICG
jgi:hypothetical protein